MSLLKTNEIQNYNGSSLTLTASTVSTSAQLNTGGNISVTGSLNVSDDSTTRTNLGLGTIATQDSDSITVTGGTATLGALTVSGSDSGNLVRITQTGSGNALVVEDSANPDSTPFVVDADGFVKIGTTIDVSPSTGAESPFQVAFVGSTTPMAVFRQGSASAQGAELILEHARSGTTNALVGSTDKLGEIRIFGADGTNFIEAASIVGSVDGTPGTNDMPGVLVFSTTQAGASSPTEAMRIDSNQSVQIQNNTSSDALRITQTGSGNALVVEDSTNPDSTPFFVDNNGDVGIGANDTTNGSGKKSSLYVERVAGDSCVISGYMPTTVNDRQLLALFSNEVSTNNLQHVLDTDGEAYNRTGTWTQISSDVRVKQDITPVSSQWDDLKAIELVNFRRKDEVVAEGYEAKKYIGVIAQQAEQVSPSLVKSRDPHPEEIAVAPELGELEDNLDRPIYKQYRKGDDIPEGFDVDDYAVDENGEKIVIGYHQKIVAIHDQIKVFKDSILFWKAVGALQEAMERIESQQSQIDALTARIEALETT